MTRQDDFDLTIGQLDRALSLLVNYGRARKERDATPPAQWQVLTTVILMDDANAQTLKHHAEDMIAAGEKILRDLGAAVKGTPQPGETEETPDTAK